MTKVEQSQWEEVNQSVMGRWGMCHAPVEGGTAKSERGAPDGHASPRGSWGNGAVQRGKTSAAHARAHARTHTHARTHACADARAHISHTHTRTHAA